MKLKILLLFLCMATACGSYFFAHNLFLDYASENTSGFSGREKRNTNSDTHLREKNLTQTMVYINTLSFQELTRLFQSLPFIEGDMSENYIALLAIGDRLIHDYPEQTIQWLFDNKNKKLDISLRKIIFQALAIFYPEKIIKFPQLFTLEKWEYTSLISAFFEELTVNDPNLARELLDHQFFRQHFASWDSIKPQFMLGFAKSDPQYLLQVLNSTIDKENRFYILRALSEKYNPSNYSEGITWAKKHLSKDQQRTFISGIASKIGQQDWQAAFSIIEDFGDNIFTQNYYDGLSYWAFEEAIYSAADENPEAAIEFVENNYKGIFREEALSQIFMLLNEKYSSEKMLSIVDLLPEGLCRTRIIAPFFAKYYSEHPHEATDWLFNSISQTMDDSVFREFIWGNASKDQIYSLTDAFIQESRSLNSVFDTLSGYFSSNRGFEEGEAFAETLSSENQAIFYASFYEYTNYQYPEKTIISVQEKNVPDDLKNRILSNTFAYNINRGKITEKTFSLVKTQEAMDEIINRLKGQDVLSKIDPKKMSPEAEIRYVNALEKNQNETE